VHIPRRNRRPVGASAADSHANANAPPPARDGAEAQRPPGVLNRRGLTAGLIGHPGVVFGNP
jgi:hypothetical protein